MNHQRSKSRLARWLPAFVIIAALAGPMRLLADSRQERRDYTTATNVFSDGNYREAETRFNNFVSTYTNSTRLTNALFFLVRSKIGSSNYTGALALLKQKLPADDPAALNLMALAYYGAGDYTNAASSCARLLQKLPADDSSLLGVARLQAQSLSKLQDWPGVIELLSDPSGAFQKAAAPNPGNEEAVNGFLLLGEAYLKESRYAQAESSVRQAATNALGRELKWKRDYLLCRILLDAGRSEEALTNSVELAALQAGQSEVVDTTFLRAEILERLRRLPEALAQYTNNLAPGLPPETNRKALRKMIELTPRPDAILQLEQLINQRPKDPILDLARWYLGDLYLKTYFAPAGDTNYLTGAITNLARLIQDFPESELIGKARLDLGWIDWSQGKFAEAKTNFLQAVLHLPYSEERAVALLKLADTQFKQGDYGDAARHYDQLLTDYAGMESVTNGLFDRTLFQLAQADIKVGDEKGAEAAAARILDWYRESGFGERSLLLLGENSSRKADYVMARVTFTNLLQAYPNTALQPDIQFAIARTYEQEGDWTNAVEACDHWLANTNFTVHELRPRVEFARALDSGKAGQGTNALAQMINFVNEYQSNSLVSNTLAPLAQNWIGDYYLNHGDNTKADYAYQSLWVKFPYATPLVYQARLMAGRAAQAYDLPQASNDFLVLTENTNTPAAIRAEAYFQLGFTDFLQFQANPNPTNQPLFESALAALVEVTNATLYKTLAPQALGQLGNCWLRWAALDINKTNAFAFNNAAQMFQAELELPQADVTARSQAEYGLGLVETGLNRPDKALTHYLRVVYNDVIHDDSTETPDPVWVKEAGVAAVQLYEQMKEWPNAISVYARVKAVVPTLGPEMDRKIAQAQKYLNPSAH